MYSGLIHRINGSTGSENGRPASSSHQGSKTRTKITKTGKQLVKGRRPSVNKRRKRDSTADNSRTSNKIELRFRPYIQWYTLLLVPCMHVQCILQSIIANHCWWTCRMPWWSMKAKSLTHLICPGTPQALWSLNHLLTIQMQCHQELKSNRKENYTNWAHFNNPGRNTSFELFRAAGCKSKSSYNLKPQFYIFLRSVPGLSLPLSGYGKPPPAERKKNKKKDKKKKKGNENTCSNYILGLNHAKYIQAPFINKFSLNSENLWVVTCLWIVLESLGGYVHPHR